MMSSPETSSPALLPMGFVDLLPQEAEAEARGIAKVMAVFGRHGYERVRPPLLEFESSLLSGAGEALSEQSFRMLDPSSHRMMALRPDMTTQIARIAEVRLKDLPRPLRLSYSGDCVVIGTPGREGERQVAQAGIELIGPDSAAADAEVIALGAEALQAMGIEHISFDLSMPVLVWTLIDESFAGTVRDNLIHALDRRDAAAVAEQGGELADLFLGMMNAAGPAKRALELLDALTFPERLKGHVARLKETVRAVLHRVPEVHVTVDPIDFRGWRYHTGVCMTVFALNCREELGRGGRYRAGEEDACGLTLHPQALLRVAPSLSKTSRCMVPAGLSKKDLSSLHEAGYATVAALDDEADLKESARHLRCSHIWQDGVAVAL
ncbi:MULTISPECIES: ATP phosphoribosyltransferase regulatory subunit [unclassified Saccharibacter]|uniref:ATP phosphoribosyltransferase regulatory subunit n=1 Tax=unclassified Saccharibacter TaxID=2648722 RepID=UPI00132834CA|nr:MULTISPECIES: ATP phosphoribosyltransferase regulatory subunit [unclassified Saccharibacter]MXV36581.1 ATP phosphoribosyltransferase regulatory subunit [Saccharibacter sp. EH611]MXV57743.1 ATP phosphoribosyltransferase regulatory subunit [Saccharibacter sp. EH70]MXV64950.1 ATP phosphoribosyltransferase regulatory subunit [Saccharibacter sp. EH60]